MYIILALILSIVVFIILSYLSGRMTSSKVESPHEKSVMDELAETEIGKLKIDLAKKQIRKNGVGVVIHKGKVYTLIGNTSPREGTAEFDRAYEKSMSEMRRKDKK